MPYILRCVCGSRIPVYSRQAGSRVQCPECEQSVEIPTIRGLSKLEIAVDSAVGRQNRSDSPPRWTVWKGAIAAICFVVALLGIGRSGLYAYYRWTHPTPFSEVDLLREAEEMVNGFTPAEAWDTWRHLQETGLGAKNPPQALVTKRFLEAQDRAMTKWAVAGVIGLAGLLAFACWPWKSSQRLTI